MANEFDAPLQLFRGDRLNDIIKPGRQFSEGCILGLAARYILRGNSSFYHGRDFVDFVLDHVGCKENTPEYDFLQASPLISFTTNLERALYYMTNRGAAKVAPCSILESDRFLYRFLVDVGRLQPTRWRGAYLLKYRKDLANCARHAGEDPVSIGLLFGPELRGEDLTVEYRALLVDVVEFLDANSAGRPTAEYRRAKARAQEDSEWLLYPADPLPDDPIAPSATFKPNRHLEIFPFRSDPTQESSGG